MSRQETEIENDDKFINLLWDDILFVKILPALSIKELFILRSLSTKYKHLIDSFFSQMKYLNLSKYGNLFGVEAFKVLTDKCSQLKTIVFTNCQWLTDELIIPFFKNNLQLKKIVLNHCKNLTSVCLQPVIILCELESLSLAGCKWLTVGCLQSITLHQRRLVEVDLSETHSVSDVTAINNFLKLSVRLKSLNLSKLLCVDDLTMSIIAHSAKDLEMLNVTGCQRVTSHGVWFVTEYCHKLKAVVCFGCPLVNHFSMIYEKNHQNLQIFSDNRQPFPIRFPRINV